MTHEEELQKTLELLQSYQDLAIDQMDDDSYMARGNGFCDRKYSDDFIAMRIAELTARVADLRHSDTPNNDTP